MSTASKNSTIAKNGIQAEKGIELQEDVKEAMEHYFQSPIQSITRITRKKYDLHIQFKNGTTTTLQNKNGHGTGRGWSVDRRDVNGFNDEPLTTLLKTMCLKQGTERPIVPDTISKQVINLCMLGEDYPDYFTHTTTTNGRIKTMSICRTDTLMEFMYGNLYHSMVPKITCVHLNSNCYLQRKGSKKDNRADDIQMKFRLTDELGPLFIPIFPISP